MKYHSGELEVQRRAGVQDMADRVSGVMRSTIPQIAQQFLSVQRLIVAATLDSKDRSWASLLTGPEGFVRAIDERTLLIDALPVPGDPLEQNLKAHNEIGILAIEFISRRRT
ncbi:pyridoxamine 5-phosphate oxidase, partial [bacterium]|nr:pyridoxamine 5-phosphate oxidase [bacterium]